LIEICDPDKVVIHTTPTEAGLNVRGYHLPTGRGPTTTVHNSPFVAEVARLIKRSVSRVSELSASFPAAHHGAMTKSLLATASALSAISRLDDTEWDRLKGRLTYVIGEMWPKLKINTMTMIGTGSFWSAISRSDDSEWTQLKGRLAYVIGELWPKLEINTMTMIGTSTNSFWSAISELDNIEWDRLKGRLAYVIGELWPKLEINTMTMSGAAASGIV